MTTPRKPGFMLPVAITLAVLLGLYFGAYRYRLIQGGAGDGRAVPFYRSSDEFMDLPFAETRSSPTGRFISLAHWLDRCIRPGFWGVKRSDWEFTE